jgi:hypothetical protein
MTDLLGAAQNAYDKTRFYSDLYGERPKRPQGIPVVNHAHYHRVQGLLDCITNREDVVGALPAYRRNVRRFPFNVVESDHEAALRHKRFVGAMRDLGFPLDRSKRRFLLLIDDACGPFGCELSKALSWERQQASMTCFNGNPGDLAEDIRAHAPDVMVLVARSLAADRPPLDGVPCIMVEHVESLAETPSACPTLLVCDELHVIASRPPEREAWRYAGDQILLEKDAASGLLCVTTLRFSCFPLIRYNLGCLVSRLEPIADLDCQQRA